MALDQGFRAGESEMGRPRLLWDNHACLPLRADAQFLPQLERHHRAGVAVVSVNVGFASTSWIEPLQILSFMRQWFSRNADKYSLVSTVEDIHRSQQAGKLGVVFDIEGMSAVQDNLTLVQTFYELGVRWMLIAYNRNNAAGGGCMDSDPGLTATGRAIIDEMERVGMVLCLSHTGTRTAADALEYARKPVIFSHSNPYGDVAHPRNISDDLIRACARTDGVVGLSGFGPFLGSAPVLVDVLLRQLHYAIDLVGTSHVGLGLDYVFDASELAGYVKKNPQLFPPGFDRPEGIGMLGPEVFHEIAERLARGNFAESDIRQVLGGNWLRVASTTWK
jgi:membrane dipeptidase